MLFSIIVPCYNAKPFLRNCLNSILAQQFDDFEVIVIDDGSTDGSDVILDEYAEKHSNIHVYHFSNAGVSSARRRGISLASGEYFIFVDSDDSINPNLLLNLYITIFNHDKPDLIRYQANLVNDVKTKNHQRYNFCEFVNTPLDGMEALKIWSRPRKKYAVYWLYAFRKIVFSRVLFSVDLKCYEDVALIPILIATASNVICIDYVGYNYTCNNPESLTNIRTLDAERSRALDFLHAYEYAISNFMKLDNVSAMDIAFFTQDYSRRLRGKFDSLPAKLKSELAPFFKL